MADVSNLLRSDGSERLVGYELLTRPRIEHGINIDGMFGVWGCFIPVIGNGKVVLAPHTEGLKVIRSFCGRH